ncbi:MAG: acyl transferase [Thermoflavifilum aggregans]|nr:acyl transferase [Thermoflavifilum aggregans]
MFSIKDFKAQLFSVSSETFEAKAIELFHYQYHAVSVYRTFVDHLHINPQEVKQLTDIPFLPVASFKYHAVTDETDPLPACYFESSTTTGLTPSRHYVRDPELYRKSLVKGFQQFYGPLDQYAILGLLPHYLERPHSSLIFMVREWMDLSQHPENGFYLNDTQALSHKLRELEARQQPTILLGVTYALLDFAAQYPMPLRHTIVMETGGMKGRRREMIREEVHEMLQKAFQVDCIHAEYGMAELLSQAYARCKGQFACPPWMRVLVRDSYDPMDVRLEGQGVLNIIDLANVHSCAFLATEDVGRVYADGSFEVLGRLDASEWRGCNLLVA